VRRLSRSGISVSSVGRIWRQWNIQPHRLDMFKFSTDPEVEAKLRDVVGLYMSPPKNAVVAIFFGIITRQAIRRGSSHRVDDLETTISAYIAHYNERATPFILNQNRRIAHRQNQPQTSH
jgi:hypothetical protein